ncbi:MAG: DUF3127 domain-containing protein [Flavobacteriales bacterium]
MELSGKVIALLDEQSGQGKNGTWRKREFVIETNAQYPKKVCISVWGDKIGLIPSVGTNVTVGLDVESREYDSRWYTEVKAWKINTTSAEAASAPDLPPPVSVNDYAEAGSSFDSGSDENDDLPF